MCLRLHPVFASSAENMLTLWEFGLRCVSLTWHLANGPRLQWAYELSSLVILQPKGALLLLQCGWSCLRITSWPTGLFWYRLGPWWLVLQVVEQQFGTWSTLLSVLRLFWELWSDSWIQMKTFSNVFFLIVNMCISVYTYIIIFIYL